MTQPAPEHGMRFAELRKMSFWAVFGLFATIGFFTIVGPLACSAIRPVFYEDTSYPKVRAPGTSLAAYRTVTRGGLGTVWTTRIYLIDTKDNEERLIYETRDSDNVPSLRWLDGETLVISLPCDRIDHLSNPADWDEGKTAMERVAVRFVYLTPCGLNPRSKGK